MNQTPASTASSAAIGTMAVLHPGVEAAHTAARGGSAAPVAITPAAAPAGPRLAARLSTLRGKRLALFENGKVNALQILVAVGKRLEARHGVAETKVWRKRHAGGTGAEIIPLIMAWKPDLVLVSTGD